MTTTIKSSYATAATIAITLGNLANGAAREGPAVNNATTLYLDAILYLAIALVAGVPSSLQKIRVYLYASHDGTNYTDNATGSDAAITLRTPTNLILLGEIACPTSGGLTWKGVFPSVAAACGGILPKKWGIVVENRTGLEFAAAGHTTEYTGLYAQQVL